MLYAYTMRPGIHNAGGARIGALYDESFPTRDDANAKAQSMFERLGSGQDVP
jgi:hypothetical protein